MKLNSANISIDRFGRLKILVFSLSILLFQVQSYSQELKLSGPLFGKTSDTTFTIWLQTNGEARINLKLSDGRTFNLTTKRDKHFISKKEILVRTFGILSIEIDVNEGLIKKSISFNIPNWNSKSSFSFAFGSCSYLDDPAVDEKVRSKEDYPIFKSIKEQEPDFLLWLGDNLYFREEDYQSREGLYKRYRYDRSHEAVLPVLNPMFQFAIWDDHDFGPNNSDSDFELKADALDAFNDNWANPEPLFSKNGITTKFSWSGVDFFLLDNRSFRINPEKEGKAMIWGKAQMDWLIKELKESHSELKVICTGGQFISSAKIFENHANIAPDERKTLLETIEKENIKGVLFLSGDRHHSELSALKLSNDQMIYDWTVSPFTAKYYDPSDEGNELLVKESYFSGYSFGLVTIDPEKKELNLKSFNDQGESVWEFSIPFKELN